MRLAALSAAALLCASPAAAQIVNFSLVSRTGSPRGATTLDQRFGAVDCAHGELLRLRAVLPTATTAPPELWVATGHAICDEAARTPGLGQTCFPICTNSIRYACTIPYGEGATDYVFTIPVPWLVDPELGQCLALNDRRYFQVLVNGAVVARVSPSLRIDLVPPAAPYSVSATRAATEEAALVTWTYPTADSGLVDDASVDAGDDAGSTDDAATDAGADAGSDAGAADAAVAGPTEIETLARFWVLCDPPPSVGASGMADGGACSSALATLDVTDTAALQRYQCQTATVDPTARSLTIGALASGVPRRFAVVAEDLAGNRSTVALASDCVTPLAVTDFWEQYHLAHGAAEPASCAVRSGSTPSRGAGAFIAAAVVAFVVRRRRSRGLRAR